MRCVGVAVHVPRKGRPEARVIVVDGAWGAASEHGSFELTSNKGDLATILYDLASGLRSHLSGLGAARVVIRQADFQKAAASKDGTRLRLIAEGALAAAARGQVNEVFLLSGKDLADRTPAQSKDDLDAEAARQLPDAPVGAAAAGLAGLHPALSR
jgi:hypothetical protein